MLCTGCWVPVGRHDPCRRCKSVHTVTRRDEVITPYGSRPDTQGNNHNRPAAHCYARKITGAQSCGKKKKESADLQSTLSSFLAANATLSGAKESWGVARGDRKPWCPVPFCPSPREGRVLHAAACKSPLPPGGGNPRAPGGARPRTPQRAKLLAAEGGNYNPSEGRVSPPAAHRRIGGGLSSADGKNAACACLCPCPGGHIPVGDYSHFSQTSGQYPTVA